MDQDLRKAERQGQDIRIEKQRLGQKIEFREGDLVRVVEHYPAIKHHQPWLGVVEIVLSNTHLQVRCQKCQDFHFVRHVGDDDSLKARELLLERLPDEIILLRRN